MKISEFIRCKYVSENFQFKLKEQRLRKGGLEAGGSFAGDSLSASTRTHSLVEALLPTPETPIWHASQSEIHYYETSYLISGDSFEV